MVAPPLKLTVNVPWATLSFVVVTVPSGSATVIKFAPVNASAVSFATLSAPGTVFTGASGIAASVTVTVAAAEESAPSEAVTVKVFAPFSLSAGS